jgi:hypothetical protein
MKNLTNFTGNSKQVNVKFTLDKYTKLVLSIIALCLILIVTNIYFKPGELNAYQTVQDVNIKSINGSSLWGSELPVDLKEINGRSISNDNIPVNIQSVKGRDLWDDKLPVDIKSINGSFIYGSEVPVKVR